MDYIMTFTATSLVHILRHISRSYTINLFSPSSLPPSLSLYNSCPFLSSGESDASEVDYVYLDHFRVEKVRGHGCTTIKHHIDEIDLVDSGDYTCNAVFNNGTRYGPESTGRIIVVGEHQ